MLNLGGLILVVIERVPLLSQAKQTILQGETAVQVKLTGGLRQATSKFSPPHSSRRHLSISRTRRTRSPPAHWQPPQIVVSTSGLVTAIFWVEQINSGRCQLIINVLEISSL